MPGGTAWIDTGALVALASTRDQYHARATALAESYTRSGGQWVGSVLVLSEFHWHMLRRGGPSVARSALAPVLVDPVYRWLDVTHATIASAVGNWLERFPDQDFSLTDAVSFELMKREGLTSAFAFDNDYVVAGFTLVP